MPRLTRLTRLPAVNLRRPSLSRPFRRTGKPGAAPGTVTVSPESPKPVLRGIGYGPDRCVEEPLAGPEAIAEFRTRFPVSWINVDGLGDAKVLERIGEEFHIHPLALEDVSNTHQRAKVEDYADHLFVIADMIGFEDEADPPAADPPAGKNPPAGQAAPVKQAPPPKKPPRRRPPPEDIALRTEQISLFLGKDWVLTFQERPGDCLGPVRTRLRRKRGRVRDRGADYLAYALVDAVMDGYYPVLDRIGARLETLDAQIAGRGGRDLVPRLHRLRGDLLLIRKVLLPHREMANALLREDRQFITDETRLFLRDAYDHAVQLLEVAETYRELCGDLRDFHYAQVNTRSGEVTKVLTIVGGIFLPLSFIAGLYGMNFDPSASPLNMPELHWFYGYPFALSLMGSVALALLLVFWRLGWLRRDG